MKAGLGGRALDVERARRDAHWFLFESGWVQTKDEHDALHPVKAFPDTLYLRAYLDCLLVSGRCLDPQQARWALEAGVSAAELQYLALHGVLMAEKSRQVFLTWATCGYVWWRARSRAHQLILVQSKREEDAAALVYHKEPQVARISFMESHLPSFARMVPFPKGASDGVLFFPNGSRIWAIPEGGHIIRSNTPSVVFSDEAAFQPEFGESYSAAGPAIDGGGQYIAVSSAYPGAFCDLVGGVAA